MTESFRRASGIIRAGLSQREPRRGDLQPSDFPSDRSPSAFPNHGPNNKKEDQHDQATDSKHPMFTIAAAAAEEEEEEALTKRTRRERERDESNELKTRMTDISGSWPVQCSNLVRLPYSFLRVPYLFFLFLFFLPINVDVLFYFLSVQLLILFRWP